MTKLDVVSTWIGVTLVSVIAGILFVLYQAWPNATAGLMVAILSGVLSDLGFAAWKRRRVTRLLKRKQQEK